MAGLGCCIFWFIAGLILGWLLHHFFSKLFCCKKSTPAPYVAPPPPPAPAPVAKVADVPVAKAAPAPESVKAAPVAKAAAAVAVIDLAAAKAAGFALKNANDLTIIEGIGPKINELFNNNGLKTFAQVAKSTVPEMRAILDKGGPRYRIANPSTWAEQAALAADNNWTALKKLQDELSGGVKK